MSSEGVGKGSLRDAGDGPALGGGRIPFDMLIDELAVPGGAGATLPRVWDRGVWAMRGVAG